MNIKKLVTILLLSCAVIFSLITLMPSGSSYCAQEQCGVFFWGANEHDGIWHLAVSNTLLSNIPFEMPNMSGSLIRGYNYLLDMIIALLAYTTKIDSSIWFFKIQPIVWVIVFIYSSYKFAVSYKKSNYFHIFLWFFLFFGSSFGYVLQLANRGTIWGSSSILSMQSLQNLLNPQFAWSLVTLLVFLTGLNLNKRKPKDYLWYGFLAAIAISLKFYTGVVMSIMIGVDLIIQFATKKDDLKFFCIKSLLSASLVLISVLIFYNPGASSQSPFILKALAPVNPIIEDKSLFYLPTWAERLYSYSGIKLYILEILVLAIFIFLNFGSRIFALFGFILKPNLNKPGTENLIIVGAIISFLFSILLVQRGVWWNTVQFLYVSLFLTSILAADGVDKLFNKNKIWSRMFVFIILALTIPSNLDVIHTFAKFPGSAYIPNEELMGLNFLKSQPKGIVLTPIFAHRPQLGTVGTVGNSYDTAYVSAYTGKQSYLSDKIQLELTNIDYSERLAQVNRNDCKVLTEVDYAYEYIGNEYVNLYQNCGSQAKLIYKNSLINIYKID